MLLDLTWHVYAADLSAQAVANYEAAFVSSSSKLDLHFHLAWRNGAVQLLHAAMSTRVSAVKE